MLKDGPGSKPKSKTINIILLDGGAGDHCASLVAVQYIIKQYPWITPLIWTPDYLVDFAKHVLSGDPQVRSYTEMRGRYDPSKPTKTTKWDGVTSPMKIHVLDYAFLKLCDELPDLSHKESLRINLDTLTTREFDLPNKYIVLTTGFTAEVREMPAKTVNDIAKYAKSKGCVVVFLGQTQTKTGAAHVIKGTFNEEIDFSAGLNLIDKTTLLEAANIMHHSKAVIGVDNGLLHVAGCTQAPIIGGFTTVSPELRMPVRNGVLGWNFYPVVPDEDLGCRFCQVTTNFLYGHDYKKCWYKEKKEREEILCVKQMTSTKFIDRLEKLL